ncbi:exonuclease domain-containing protein [Ruminococcus sp.]|uniref:3'-5' exonuclease n=1 Tax=Ruminococcus sp. TaxID=41978 RepID=UPI00258EAAC9|nr:exonuclease domain-containing protein [Ruminococcus sp.]MCR5019439.1 hypothetical protein [Ruminococcus sp.]
MASNKSPNHKSDVSIYVDFFSLDVIIFFFVYLPFDWDIGASIIIWFILLLIFIIPICINFDYKKTSVKKQSSQNPLLSHHTTTFQYTSPIVSKPADTEFNYSCDDEEEDLFGKNDDFGSIPVKKKTEIIKPADTEFNYSCDDEEDLFGKYVNFWSTPVKKKTEIIKPPDANKKKYADMLGLSDMSYSDVNISDRFGLPGELIEISSAEKSAVKDNCSLDNIEQNLSDDNNLGYGYDKYNISSSYKNHPLVITRYNKSNEMTKDYVVFDVETTGLECEDCDIIEIAAIKYIDCVEVDRFQSYVYISYRLPPFIVKLTGITDDDLEDAPFIDEVLEDFVEFVGDFPLVAHNVKFDMKFVQTALYENLDKRLYNKCIDTVRLAQKQFPMLPNHKLPTIKEHLDVNVASHNALDDCIVTAALYKICYDTYTEKHKTDPVPSSFDDTLFDVALDILKDKDVDISRFKKRASKRYFDIIYDQWLFLRFKTTGRSTYWLIDMSYDNFKKRFSIDNSCVQAPKSENCRTRVMLDDPEQLRNYSDYILEMYDKCLNNYDHYYNDYLNRFY